MKKNLSVLALTIALFTALLPAAPARAGLWVGACVVEVRMTFNSPVRLVDTHPSYNISLNSLVPNTCPVGVLDGNLLNPLRSTSGWGTGDSIEWSCAAVVSQGFDWEHRFMDSSGNSSPTPVFNASHVMTGTWDNWVLALNQGTQFAAVAYLKLSPLTLEQTKTVNCATTGFTSLRMVGVLVFEDPEV